MIVIVGILLEISGSYVRNFTKNQDFSKNDQNY